MKSIGLKIKNYFCNKIVTLMNKVLKIILISLFIISWSSMDEAMIDGLRKDSDLKLCQKYLEFDVHFFSHIPDEVRRRNLDCSKYAKLFENQNNNCADWGAVSDAIQKQIDRNKPLQSTEVVCTRSVNGREVICRER